MLIFRKLRENASKTALAAPLRGTCYFDRSHQQHWRQAEPFSWVWFWSVWDGKKHQGKQKKHHFLLNTHTKIQVRFLSKILLDMSIRIITLITHDLHKINLNSTFPSSFSGSYSNQTTISPPVAQIWYGPQGRGAPGSSTVEGGTSFSSQGHLCNEVDDLQMLLLVVTGFPWRGTVAPSPMPPWKNPQEIAGLIIKGLLTIWFPLKGCWLIWLLEFKNT